MESGFKTNYRKFKAGSGSGSRINYRKFGAGSGSGFGINYKGSREIVFRVILGFGRREVTETRLNNTLGTII